MHKAVIALPIVAAVLIGGYFIDRARTAKERRLSGFFESQPSLASSRLGGRVTAILVREGDNVQAGQALVRLEDRSYAAATEAQEKAAEQAQQQYVETFRGVRTEEIAKSRSAVDEAKANLDRLLAGARPEEIASARAGANVALARLKQAERGLTREERSQFKARVDGAIADEGLAKKQLERAEFLYNQGAAPKQQYDTALAAYQQAQARRNDAEQAYRRAEEGTPKEEMAEAREAYRQAVAQLQLVTKGPRKEEIAAARARLDQARAGLQELEHGSRPEDVAKAKAAHEQAKLQAQSAAENLKENVVYASQPAIVDRILVAAGDLVQPGAPAVQLSYPTDLWMRIYMPEQDLGKIKPGDSAELVIDGIPGTVAAVVENIASKGEFTPANLQSPEERGRQVFGVRLRLAKPDARVKPGMAATVTRVGAWP